MPRLSHTSSWELEFFPPRPIFVDLRFCIEATGRVIPGNVEDSLPVLLHDNGAMSVPMNVHLDIDFRFDSVLRIFHRELGMDGRRVLE